MTFFFPTPTPRFPSLQSGYSFKMKPTYSPAIATCVSGNELRIARQTYPLWDFELIFEALREQTQNPIIDPYYAGKTDLEQLCGLFLVCRGQYGRFYFSCLEDNSRLGAPTGIGNGVVSDFPIQRIWGPQQFGEPVFIDQSHSWKVYLNGIDDSANWSIAGEGTLFARSSPPAIGDVITADFFFLYLCRFLEDLNDFEQFYHNLYRVGSLKFRSAKPDTPIVYTNPTFSNGDSLVIDTKYFAFTNVPNKPIYYLIFQTDGNLVIYRRAVGFADVALWGSGTAGMSMPGTCIMQSDGNLVITDSGSVVQFATGTFGNPGAFLIMQVDGNLVIYSTTGAVLWSSGTAE